MRFVVMVAGLMLSVSLFADLDTKKMQMMVQKIKEPREDISSADIGNVASPFVEVENIKVKEQMAMPKPSQKKVIVEQNITLTPLNLKGTVNDEANINGEWLKSGEIIGEYKIVNVGDGKVRVQKGESVQELSISEFRQIIRLR